MSNSMIGYNNRNGSGYNEDQIRDNFNGTNGHTGAYIDKEGVVRWNSNDQIPFEDMLADFRTLDLINEENQLHSNLLREKETEEFWDEYMNYDENGMSISQGRLW